MKSVLIKLSTSVALIIASPVIILAALFFIWKPRDKTMHDLDVPIYDVTQNNTGPVVYQ